MNTSTNKKFYTRTEYEALNALLFQIERAQQSTFVELRITAADASKIAENISAMQLQINDLKQKLIAAQQDLIKAQQTALEFAKEQKISISLNGGTF
jgi:esterase/lipase superfamily enzyme